MHRTLALALLCALFAACSKPAAPPPPSDPPVSGASYEAATALLAALAADPGDAKSAYSLASHGHDPRVGPALEAAVKALAARGDFARDDRLEDAMSAAVALGDVQYGPAAETLAAVVEQVSRGDWWARPRRCEALPMLLEAYANLAPAPGAQAYNRIVSASVTALLESEKGGAGDGEFTLPSWLFTACTDHWTSDTVRLFAGILEGPDSARIDTEGTGYPPALSSLHSTARYALELALPSTEDWTAGQYVALAERYPDLASWYLHELQTPGDHGWLLDKNYIGPLVARKATVAAPVIDAILDDPKLSALDRVSYASMSICLGSFKGIETLYAIESSNSDDVGRLAARQLRVFTGLDLGDDGARWQRWIMLARERLKWDVEAGSWRPAEEWERIRLAVEMPMAPSE